MRYNAIVADWNGTLFEPKTDEGILKYLGFTMLRDHAYGRKFNPLEAIKLLCIAGQTVLKLKSYKKGDAHLREVYEKFNKALKGKRFSYVLNILEDCLEDESSKLDERILRPIDDMHRMGSKTGILSVSFDMAIRQILGYSPYSDTFDYIISNKILPCNLRLRNVDDGLELDAKTRGLTLDIHGKKDVVMEKEFFKLRDWNPDTTAYSGDDEDDELIAPLLKKGNFIVPFLATDGFKEHMASRYGAFVPENAEDLRRYLFSQ